MKVFSKINLQSNFPISHIFNPSVQEVEAEGLLQVEGHITSSSMVAMIDNKTLSQKNVVKISKKECG